jgi:hypothetical protein
MTAATPVEGGAGANPGRQRALIIGAAGLVTLLVFFFIIKPLLFGGGDDTTPSTQPPLARPRVTTTTVAAPGGAPAETFDVFQGKNPFEPLVNPAGTGGTTETTSGGGGGATGTTVAGGGSSTGGGGTSGGAATEPRRSQRVALVSVYQSGGKTVADVRVNDTVYPKLAPGDTFATNYKVVSLQGNCGTFLFGDERFQLCEGEEVLK